jgi:hypothetical protein
VIVTFAVSQLVGIYDLPIGPITLTACPSSFPDPAAVDGVQFLIFMGLLQFYDLGLCQDGGIRLVGTLSNVPLSIYCPCFSSFALFMSGLAIIEVFSDP